MVTINKDAESKPEEIIKERSMATRPGQRGRIVIKTKFPRSRQKQHPGKKKAKSGLPSFKLRTSLVSIPTSNNSVEEYEEEEVLPSETLMAIQSLQSLSQGLHVPIGNQQMIQAILESQIFQRFDEGHASTIMSELLDLVHRNHIRKLLTKDANTKTAFVFTTDYIDALKSLQDNCSAEKVLSWFVSNLKHWTQASLSKECMADHWKEDILVTTPPTKNDHSTNPPKPLRTRLSLDDALNLLLKLQVLIRDSSNFTNNTELYQLWLPQWGVVLKAWNEARQQLLGYIARSKGGEASEKNVLSQNRHSTVSTKFLLDELTHEGKLRIIQRPFGKFVRVPDNK